MARNLQVIYKGLAPVLMAVLLGSGCAKAPKLENPYSFEARQEHFDLADGGGFYDGFAGGLCVVKETDDADEGLTAQAAAVFGLDGGTASFQKNPCARMNPASTTKIMTAILALKYGSLSDTVTVTEDAVITEAGSSMAGVKPGDRISLEDLLYGLLIPSGNDAANAIAVHVGGSIEGFVSMMNEEAARLGATGTHFANANGLTDPDHYTTAYDLYLMFHEALKYDTFRTIIGAQSHTAVFADGDGNEKSAVWNVGNYYMNGKTETPEGLTVFGGKTGTTKAAGYCLIMGSRTDDGREFASVIMDTDSRNDLYADMTKIISKFIK